MCNSPFIQQAHGAGFFQAFFDDGEFLLVPTQDVQRLSMFLRSHEGKEPVRPLERRFYSAIRAIYNDLSKLKKA